MSLCIILYLHVKFFFFSIIGAKKEADEKEEERRRCRNLGIVCSQRFDVYICPLRMMWKLNRAVCYMLYTSKSFIKERPFFN
jgi:hypothetical protein